MAFTTGDWCSALNQLTYEISYIHLYSSPSMGPGYIMNSQKGQLPVGLIAQLVEHCTDIAVVMGLNPIQAWIFSHSNFTTAEAVYITTMINPIFTWDMRFIDYSPTLEITSNRKY